MNMMNISTMNDTEDMLAVNTSTNKISLGECPIEIPHVAWALSSFNQAVKVSTGLAIFVNFMTMPLTLFLNALIMFVVWKYPSLQVERVIVLAYLALTDFLVGLVCQPLFIVKEISYLKNEASSCDLESAFFLGKALLVGASFYQLVVLTYERYVAIIHPYEYPTRITVKRLTYAAIGLWTLNAILVILYFVFLTFKISFPIDKFNVILKYIMIGCIVYFYVRIFAAIRKQKRLIGQQQQNANHQNTLQNHKGAIVAALLLGCFILSFIPLLIFVLLTQVFGLNLRNVPALLFLQPWAETFVLLNSFINPLIYGVRTRELREKWLRFFGVQNNDIDSPQNPIALPTIT